MLLDLSRFTGGRSHVERRYAPAAFSGDEFAATADVALVFELDKDEKRYRLAGTIETTLELACGRCLEPFQLPVAVGFDLRYVPQSENRGENEREVEEDDLSTAFYQGETINLGDLVREQLYLTLPMKPLCRAECRGLCPECGANLNAAACGCAPRWEDPRLAPLRTLLDDGKD